MMPGYAWPSSLLQVAERHLRGERFDPTLREFLDFFYTQPEAREAAIASAPPLIDALKDAYLAATAEYLAHVYKLPVPDWTDTQGNALTQPYFAGGLDSLKAILFVESPTAFRRRLLFVSKNALSRPREREQPSDEATDISASC